jgi:hypothetical protein
METPLTLVDAFVSALAASPNASARLRGTNETLTNRPRVIDAVIEAEIAGKPLLLLVETKNTAYPRDVREAAWQLRAYLAEHRPNSSAREVVPFIIAEAISPGARETLRSEGIGYFDRGGSLFLPSKGAFIFVDKPPAKAEARALGSIFTGRKAQILQAIFLGQGDWFTVKDIAEKVGVSAPTASKALSDLERRDWIEVRGSGPSKARRLANPSEALDAWTKFLVVQKQADQRRYFIPGSSENLVRRFADACALQKATYAVTGEVAGQAYSPFLSSVSQLVCRMLVGEAAVSVLEKMQARTVNEGWNLAVIESRSLGDFFRTTVKDGVTFANPLQVYLDLVRGGGRSKELAEHLRRTILLS